MTSLLCVNYSDQTRLKMNTCCSICAGSHTHTHTHTHTNTHTHMHIYTHTYTLEWHMIHVYGTYGPTTWVRWGQICADVFKDWLAGSSLVCRAYENGIRLVDAEWIRCTMIQWDRYCVIMYSEPLIDASVTGQNIPPAGVYPGILWPRPIYTPEYILA